MEKLEKAANEYADKHGFRVPYDGSDKFYDEIDVKASYEGFKEGANWWSEHIWHDASETPSDKSRCLVMLSEYYDYGGVEYLLYNENTREFVSDEYPHPTGNKVEQKSLEGGVVAEVYKNMRDRFPLTDIYKWAYIEDILPIKKEE